MNALVEKNLPGFRMFNAFFADLKGDFEPVVCTPKEKREYVASLKTLTGYPAHEFGFLREDLDLTAKVREMRRYGVDKTFVRFEFKRLESNCTWSVPFQLMGIFDDLKNLTSYTVMHERGLFKEGVTYCMTKVRYCWDNYEMTEDPVAALAFLDAEDTPEVQIVDKATGRSFAFIYGGMGSHKCAFDVEWYVGCDPWLMERKNVRFDFIERIFEALKDGGVKAFEDAADWVPFSYRASCAKHGVHINIDRELTRILERAKRDKNIQVERTMRALGIDGAKVDGPFCVRLCPGTPRRLKLELFNMSCDESREDGERTKILAYLANHGVVNALNNLGYQFHFGRGVKTDYDLAVYWHKLGAEAGDHYSMLSLGKIFSEKTSPVWDGPEAIKWFENAIKHGDDWAKGELGHCLLCGKCIERDFVRAESLLEDAVAACPDREDFAENLERARNRETP